jgi:hypothetical protein
MTRSIKNSRKIVVNDVEYRWRSKGDDCFNTYISIIIWPSNNIGPAIHSSFNSHETWVQDPEKSYRSYSSMNDGIVITNRIIRRIIDFAIVTHNYDPMSSGNDLGISGEENIDWNDAIRVDEVRASNLRSQSE